MTARKEQMKQSIVQEVSFTHDAARMLPDKIASSRKRPTADQQNQRQRQYAV